MEEGTQVVGVGDSDVDLGLCHGRPEPDLLVLGAPDLCHNVKVIGIHPFPVEDVGLVGPGPDHQEDKVAHDFSLGLEKLLGIAGTDLELDMDLERGW